MLVPLFRRLPAPQPAGRHCEFARNGGARGAHFDAGRPMDLPYYTGEKIVSFRLNPKLSPQSGDSLTIRPEQLS